KACGHELAPGVDLVLACARDLADLCDATVFDRDIGLEQIAAAAVSDGAPADHEVWTSCHDVSSRFSNWSMIRKSGYRFSLATNAERVCAEIMLKQERDDDSKKSHRARARHPNGSRVAELFVRL